MFDILKLTTEQISNFTGKAALKAIQNEHTFLLDLLVRESIQNSSDAAIPDAKVFKVFYNVGEFKNDNVSSCFKEITDKLNQRYSGKDCKYLEIRDSNTVGLTGETLKSNCTNDTISNYMRLIYDMGKGQDQLNAGGNWGYGKTVYYRLGNGIVIYYSRIKNQDGAYESRMILTLIENEEKADALLKNDKNNSAGRAWWGERKEGSNDLYPITDESLIEMFLDSFGITPFTEEETGTSIIIPYLDEELLMAEAKTGFKVSEEMLNRCSFLNSISSYLRYAIQKWYAPINNNFELRNYGRKFLNAYVNGDLVGKYEMYPVFKLVQELYLTAYANFAGKNYQPKYPIVCKESFANYKKHTYKCGYIAFSKLKLEDLQGDENLLPPNVYMNLFDEEYSGMISLYTRDLGMILNYEENWINVKEFSLAPEELLITLFIPDTTADITIGGETIYLGEYLREREEADHMKWDDDPAKMKVKCVKQIKNSVDTSVRKHFNPEQFEQHGESDMSEFAGVLGEKLFPLNKKAKSKGSGGGSGSGGGISRSEKRFNFFTKGISITSEGRIKVLYELELKENVKVAIKTKVSSDVAIDAEKWKEKIGTAYPLRVINLVISTKENDEEVVVSEENNEVVLTGAKNKISGTFEIEASDKKLAFVIDCEEKKEEDN